MEKESSSSELQRLMEAIKSSEVVEGRIELISKLEELHLSDKSDVASLVHCVATHWDDSTCLDVCQCILNKAILHVAGKYLDSDISGCFVQFLCLGRKACIWSGKHLKMTLMSAGESQEEEEHGITFFQLLSDVLNFDAATLGAMTAHHTLDDDTLKVIEKFILELLDLTINVMSEIKKFNSIGGEILKATQVSIESVIRLCNEYLQAGNLKLSDTKTEKDKVDINCQIVHIMNITMVTIEKLFELSILAANGGGSLVTILNVSLKAVVTLLQLGKGKLPWKGKVSEIVKSLIVLVNGSLKFAAELWSAPQKDTVSVAEARRTFLPVKFYLINAAKICSLYPCEAFRIFMDILLCILTISVLKLSLSNENHLKNASEVMAELLEKTSLDLLRPLLNSPDLTLEQKNGLLDMLFNDNTCIDSINREQVSKSLTISVDEIFSVTCAAMSKARVLSTGRVALFATFLRHSSHFEGDVNLLIARKLDWFLRILTDGEIYSFILVSQIPVMYVLGKAVELVWEPIFSTILQALKSFMIVVSSTVAWQEVESFLLENFFHPYYLCWEIIMELWCFLLRYVEKELVNDITDKLSTLMMLVASPDSVHCQNSVVRKTARSVCLLITFGSPSAVDKFYGSIVGSERSRSLLLLALLLEDFPLNLLEDSLRSVAKEKIITDYYGLVDNFDDKVSDVSSFSLVAPVFALSASLQSRQVSLSDIDKKTVKFLVTVIRGYRNSGDKYTKDIFYKLLAEGLGIISYITNKHTSDEMKEVILELQEVFVSGNSASEVQLNCCKPELALFMAALSQMGMSENDNCVTSAAMWDLYHMLLRNRHWAFAHLAVASFGYFAARTNCNQLWRFVPQDAALSYDLVGGCEASEARFMSEFKAFLEKETALTTVTRSPEQLGYLLEQGLVLKGMFQKISNMITEVVQCDSMEIDVVDVENQSNKRRKLPDGIGQGVELIQNGLRIISDSLTQWQPESAELHEKFMNQFSSLEDAIARIAGLQGSG